MNLNPGSLAARGASQQFATRAPELCDYTEGLTDRFKPARRLALTASRATLSIRREGRSPTPWAA